MSILRTMTQVQKDFVHELKLFGCSKIQALVLTATYVAPGRSAENAGLYGRPSGSHADAALRSMHGNFRKKERFGRT